MGLCHAVPLLHPSVPLSQQEGCVGLGTVGCTMTRRCVSLLLDALVLRRSPASAALLAVLARTPR